MFLKEAKVCFSVRLRSMTLECSPQVFARVVELKRWNGSQGRVGRRSGGDGVLQMMTVIQGDGLCKKTETKSSASAALMHTSE